MLRSTHCKLFRRIKHRLPFRLNFIVLPCRDADRYAPAASIEARAYADRAAVSGGDFIGGDGQFQSTADPANVLIPTFASNDSGSCSSEPNTK